jgi:glycosyltransferase involved in cell wall biosynthesis
VIGLGGFSRDGGKKGRRIAWYGPWYPCGHNNVRYEALLPRLKPVQPLYQWRSHRRWPMAVRRRLDRYVLSRLWYPGRIARLARHYHALFCTDASQVAHFPGPVIVDQDDPVFAPHRIGMLNRENVVAVVTTTALLRDRLVSEGLAKPCHVIPSGVHLSGFSEDRAAALQRSLGRRPNQTVVGFAAPRLYTDMDRQGQSPEGRLRNIAFLAAVMEHVWESEPAIQLWLMGLPSRAVREYADAHPQVWLLGYVPHRDVLEYYASFDLAVYPRPVDFGGRHSVKLVEFMAVGVPIVSTPVAESFHVEVSGAGVIAEGVEAFAGQVLRLARDAGLRRSLGELGRRYASRFDWDELAVRYEREVFGLYFPDSKERPN